jgi:3-oxoacyl-[acyl-carrier protein] reductase
VRHTTDQEQVDAAFDAIAGAAGPVEVLVANAGITRDTLLLRMSTTTGTRHRHQPHRLVPGRQRPRRECCGCAAAGSCSSPRWSACSVRRPGQLRGQQVGLVGWPRRSPASSGSRVITANVVAPGFVETDMTAVLPEETRSSTRADPARPLRPTEEVATSVRWLASDEAGYITGR